MRFPTGLRVKNRQIAGQKYPSLPNARAKVDRMHAFNAINAIGPKIGFPARRCRCPDLRPAGPFGVTPRRLAAFDPARRAPFGMPAGAAARARFPSRDPVHGCRMRRTRRLAAALAPMPPLAAPPHAEWVCPSVLTPRPLWAARPDDPVARVRLRLGGRPAGGSQKNQRPAEAGSVASAGRRGRADPVCARKACRRVPAPGRGRPRPGRRPRRVTRRGLRLPLSGRTPPARGRRARRSPCCTRGRSPVLRRVRPC